MKLGVAAAAVALVAGAALLATTNQGGQPVDLLSELPHGEFVFSLIYSILGPSVCTAVRAVTACVVGTASGAVVAKRRKAKREVDHEPYLATYFGPRCALARTRFTSNAAARAGGLFRAIYRHYYTIRPYLATYFGPRCALARTRFTSNAAARVVSPGLYTGIYTIRP